MKILIIGLFLFSTMRALGAEAERPLWQYGVGAGVVHYEHYPASDEFSDLFLPFPTFQYRGKVLRADDREGTRAYLLKKENWSLELGGGFYPTLSSSDSKARQGMKDIPWRFQLGPQLIYRPHLDWEFKWGVYQSTSTDLQRFELSGAVSELKAIYKWDSNLGSLGTFENVQAQGQLSASWKFATQDFQKDYYEVTSEYATAQRSAYQARAGSLSQEISYFQVLTSGKGALYIGGAVNEYGSSANRQSPLYKSDRNVVYLMGLTYVLGESRKTSVPIERTEGVIDLYQQRRGKPF